MALPFRSSAFLIDAFDASCLISGYTQSSEMNVIEATGICTAGAKSWVAGNVDRTINAEGFYDETPNDTPENFIEKLQGYIGGSNVKLSYAPSSCSASDIAILQTAIETKVDIQAKPGDLLMTTFEAKQADGTDGYLEGVWLMKQTVTGATNGTTVDLGGATTGYFARFIAYAGDDDATIRIEHSTNGSVWVDLIADASYARGSVADSSNAVTAVNRYVRAVASPGTTTNGVAVIFIHDYGTRY